jgi:Lrp/AsnC family leucine-responsive transcriptional regulator
MPKSTLDSFDAKLLRLLQHDNRLNADELADKVGLSPSACLRRIKRLRERGVIEAEFAVVSPEAVGRGLTMIVEVTLERERPDLIEDFKRAMRSVPEVMMCFYVTGETDFIIMVTSRTMREYEAFTRRFFFENPNVRRFHTYVVMDRVKVGLAIPIEL